MTLADILKHAPGGVQHDQESHGDWSQGQSEVDQRFTQKEGPWQLTDFKGSPADFARAKERLESAPSLYRGISVKLPDDVQAKVEALLQPAMTDAQYATKTGDLQKAGQMIIDQVTQNGVGSHWTINERWAGIAAERPYIKQEGGWSIILEIEPPPVSGMNPVQDDSGWTEGEVTLKAQDHPYTFKSVKVDRGWYKDYNLLSQPIEKRMVSILKHTPGGQPHDQSLHGDWSDGVRSDELEGGARLLEPGKGEREIKGEKVPTYLTDAEGNEVPYSHTAIIETYGPESAKYESSYRSTAETYGVDLEQLEPRIDQIYQSAQLRYENLNASAGKTTRLEPWVNDLHLEADRLRVHPWGDSGAPNWAKSYISNVESLGSVTSEGQFTWGENAGDHLYELDRFYQRWGETWTEEFALTGVSVDRMAAGASAISPSLEGFDNLLYAHDMAQMVSQKNLTLSDSQLSRSLEAMQARVDKHDVDWAAADAAGEKYRSDWQQERSDLVATMETLQSGERSFHKLNGMGMAYTAQEIRRDLTGGVGTGGVGFSVPAGYANYAKAFDVMTGVRSANEILGEVKTRSFANNSMDPDNLFGYNDVTVDFHALNMGGFMLGANTATALSGTPRINGVGLGLRAGYADAFRSVGATYGTHGSEIQQVTWGEWQRGKNDSALTWTDSGGTSHDLHRIYGGKVDKNDPLKWQKGIVIPKGGA